jgi:threonine dehydrogenase-like Zn-dependent dehydrogenase
MTTPTSSPPKTACCGGPAPAGVAACCVKDANAKAAGQADCGCNDKPPLSLPVAVIGAGPVGLSAAARLIERGIEPVVLEAGASVGASLLNYGHVRLFSPWRYDVDAAMATQLEGHGSGWTAPPPDELPLAREIVERVLQPYAELPALRRALKLDTRVTAISREGFDKVKSTGREAAPFVIRALQVGRPITLRARAVIDASGTWATPNPLGADGLPALGERENADAVFYGIPDVLGRNRARYAGRRTLVVGAGHSAANTLLALAELARSAPGTRLLWAVRSGTLTRVFGGGDADALPARGALGSALRALRDSGRLEFVSGLRTRELKREGSTLSVEGTGPEGRSIVLDGIDQIVCATGQRPDLAMVGELRLNLDSALESTAALGPLIDPNVHSCGTVRPHGHRELAHPEPGFYTLGVKSYGRAPTFLMATGFEQARSVVAAIAGDLEAADRVELDLPQTGVCSAGPSEVDGAACCGVGPVASETVAVLGARAGATSRPVVATACCS